MDGATSLWQIIFTVKMKLQESYDAKTIFSENTVRLITSEIRRQQQHFLFSAVVDLRLLFIHKYIC